MSEETEYWYRYYDAHYESRVVIHLDRIRVLRRTPKGVQLNMGYGKPRFVRLDANKQWACPTIEAARTSFLARKKRQVMILGALHNRAKAALHNAEQGLFEDGPAFHQFDLEDFG